MTIYKGVVQDGKLVLSNDTRIKVVPRNDPSDPWTTLEFPEAVQRAYVLATNFFRVDRVSLDSLTVWGWGDEYPSRLAFENKGERGGDGKWFSFLVDVPG